MKAPYSGQISGVHDLICQNFRTTAHAEPRDFMAADRTARERGGYSIFLVGGLMRSIDTFRKILLLIRYDIQLISSPGIPLTMKRSRSQNQGDIGFS